MNKVQLNKGLSIRRVALLDGLKKLHGAISGKTSIPMLTNVKIEVKEKEIILIGSDSDYTVFVALENDMNNTNDSYLVNYPSLVAFLKKVKSDEVVFNHLNDYAIEVTCNNINYTLESFNSADYPSFVYHVENEITLEKTVFEKAMKATLFATAKSESRPVLRGLNVTINQNGLEIISTDSHRLSKYVIPSIVSDEKKHVIIPADSLVKMQKIIDKKCNQVFMSFDEKQSIFRFENVTCIIRNIEGNYPETSRLIPDSFDTEIKLDTAEITDILDVMSIVNKAEKYQAITLELVEGNKVLLSAGAENTQKMKSTISPISHYGENLKICFNVSFLTDIIKNTSSDVLTFTFNGGLRPFTVTIDENNLHLILPIRIR